MRLWSVEGNRQRLDGGAMFGSVPRALWEQWIAPDQRHRIPLACRALLAEDCDGRKILFETGVGAFFDPGLRDRYGVVEGGHVLLGSLEGRGTSHQEVDVVVLSHLHFDHAGGLLTAYREGVEPELLFPKARFLVSAKAWARARAPHLRDRASFVGGLPALLEASGRLEIVDGKRSPTLGDGVRFEFSDGHTPGLMLSEIGGDGGVAFCSDLIPGRPWLRLPITMGYDRCPETLVDEKRAFLEDKMARGVRLFFTHDPEVALASLERGETGALVSCREVPSVEGLLI